MRIICILLQSFLRTQHMTVVDYLCKYVMHLLFAFIELFVCMICFDKQYFTLMCAHINIYICIYIYIYIYVCSYTHILIHVHTYTQSVNAGPFILSSSFLFNRAYFGGAILLSSSNYGCLLFDTVIHGNIADQKGG